MTDEQNVPDPVAEDTRRERWDSAGPAELEITIGGGRVRIDLVEDASEVTVEVTTDRGGAPWSGGLGGLLDWIGSSMGGNSPAGGAGWSGRGFDPIVGAPWERSGDPSADALEAVTIEWSETGRRLVVRGPEEPALSAVPLIVTVSAPAASRPAVRTGAAAVEVTGRASWAAVRTGSGTARLAEVTGEADITTGSGGIDLGSCGGRAQLRTGSGEIEAGSIGGPSRVRTGSGDIRLGELTGDLEVRSGSGDVVISDAVSGDVRLSTGSGNVRVGVHSGVAAELDLSTGSGRARSELEVHDGAPGERAVRLSGRTGSGDVLVTRAATIAA
ncbi:MULTISPECIES: DUF4097 family beta strand repeat-containing protein [Pseudonocardia]|uniref:DUF4097 domain-containing protein n=2 Tax=Pseudonocardia TaxID=1847 RepID=A0A1Y2N329_PSEAH|nr:MULTISPECIES: DUF4097 family beta strand repeat-containing protein [Pseudonocardia]OSY41308.1 hypothetical protein BG845_02210 [Pseudonocardia autotrophica]TDN76764.1 hypothetical protein C8E95_5982 [Pseudonocardia autotrophica]BBG00765.1 hypothetical protein Pdca_19740 [Pseudonocardia autotrophica]GEC24269.1 hypothetical protein PSA01_12980 [Pseudonocardia saturnea]